MKSILSWIVVNLTTSKVIKLNEINFNRVIAGPNRKEVTLVKFFAPWCPHCKNMAKDWESVGNLDFENVLITEVNCMDHFDLCEEQKVPGYPQLVAFKNGERHSVFHQKTEAGIVGVAQRLGGKLSGILPMTKGLKPAIKSEKEPLNSKYYRSGLVWKLVGKNFKKFIDFKKDALVAITKSECRSCDILLKRLYLLAKHQPTLVVAKVNDELNDLPKAFKVNEHPTIFWVSKGSSKPYRYKGEQRLEMLQKFVRAKLNYSGDTKKKIKQKEKITTTPQNRRTEL